MDVALSMTEALSLMEEWAKEEIKGKISGSRPSNPNKGQADWVINLDHCCAIHLVDLPVTPHIPPTGFTGGSGL